MNSQAQKARSRKGQRGAALVEMLVVVPVFIVLFAGMIFLHRTVAKTQRSMLAARLEAWKSAMSGCAANGDSMPQPDLTSDMNGAPGSDASILAKIGYATGTASDVAHVRVLAAQAAPFAEANGIDYHSSIHSKAVVMCNAQTQPGDLPGVLKWFFNTANGNTLWSAIFGGAH
ncbi:MAG TPA: TadE family protein [Polyangiaceae bacterium]|nr:TadE family protein [Polyangiaceae bacterium]